MRILLVLSLLLTMVSCASTIDFDAYGVNIRQIEDDKFLLRNTNTYKVMVTYHGPDGSWVHMFEPFHTMQATLDDHYLLDVYDVDADHTQSLVKVGE